MGERRASKLSDRWASRDWADRKHQRGAICRHTRRHTRLSSCKGRSGLIVPSKLMSKMLEEIRHQPEALERTLRAELPHVEKFKLALARSKPRLIVLVARGTSDNAALFGRYLLEITTGIPVSLSAPSVHTLYRTQVNLSGALVIAISQSGESTDTNQILQDARKRGAMTVGITNEPKSSLTKLAERVFLVRAGKERSVAATKTYTGQIMLLYLLAYALGANLKIDDLRRIPALLPTRSSWRTRLQACNTISIHGPRRGSGPRAQLFERVRICAQADGDVLRGG